MAEVAAVLQFVLWDRGRDILRLVQNQGRETMGQVKFPDGDFYVNTEVVLAAEDLDHLAAGALGCARPVGDLDIDSYAFEVGPVRVARAFFAQDSMA
jgi:hypothetical protein